MSSLLVSSKREIISKNGSEGYRQVIRPAQGVFLEEAVRSGQRGERLLSSEDMIIIDFEFQFVN
jgi:hypothetical protein